MKSVMDEFLHEAGADKDWSEIYTLNFCDKKSKIFGSADVEYLPKKKLLVFGWDIFCDGNHFTDREEVSVHGELDGKKYNSDSLKLNIVKPGEKSKFEIKSPLIHASLDCAGLFHVYDYPLAPDAAADLNRKHFEDMLWKRIEQRCKITGMIKYKNAAKKLVNKKIECWGQKEKEWGGRLYEKLEAHSRYYIQFRDMSLSLTYINFKDAVLSSGFISKKSANIPIEEAELEHIDIGKDGLPLSSEISYRDSRDEKDLIVSNRLHALKYPPKLLAKKQFFRFKVFSEYSILGAMKKGIGMEDHFMTKEFLQFISSDK